MLPCGHRIPLMPNTTQTCRKSSCKQSQSVALYSDASTCRTVKEQRGAIMKMRGIKAWWGGRGKDGLDLVVIVQMDQDHIHAHVLMQTCTNTQRPAQGLLLRKKRLTWRASCDVM